MRFGVQMTVGVRTLINSGHRDTGRRAVFKVEIRKEGGRSGR